MFLVHVEHAQLDGIAEAGVCVADKPHEVLDVNNGIHLDAMRSCLGPEWMRLGRAESSNPSARFGRRRARARASKGHLVGSTPRHGTQCIDSHRSWSP